MEQIPEELILLISEEKYEEALVKLEAQLDCEPKNLSYLYWTGFCYLQIHNPLAAIHALSMCIEQENTLEYHTALMIAHFDAAQFEQALSLIQQGLQQHPKESQYWRYLAYITARNDRQQADAFFHKAQELSPQEYPLPSPLPDHAAIERALSWLPSAGKKWIESLEILYEDNPSFDLLYMEAFPNHPLLPFILLEDTLFIFMNNLSYHPPNQSAESYLFEQLLDLWNHIQQQSS